MLLATNASGQLNRLLSLHFYPKSVRWNRFQLAELGPDGRVAAARMRRRCGIGRDTREVAMRSAGRVLSIATLMVLTGCWTVPGAGPQRSGHNPFETAITPANAASLGREWTWQADWTTPRQVSDPVISVSGVHVAVVTSW